MSSAISSHPGARVPGAPESPPRWTHSPLWMVLIGFAVRVLYIFIAHAYRFRLEDDHFGIGWEMGRIARSIVLGWGFSSPFDGNTGPTAWVPPLYPYVIAAAFKLFGIYSKSATIALLIFNSVFGALTSWTIFRIAQRMFNQTVAVWSGWLWALLPYTIYWAVRLVWETSFSTFILSAILLLTLTMEHDNSFARWALFGFLFGVAALSNTAMGIFLPFAGLWLVWQMIRQEKTWLLQAIVSALVFVAVLMPWIVRNQRVFHKGLMLRSNFGVELHCGNNPIAEGVLVRAANPMANVIDFALYRTMGEVNFSTAMQQEASGWIRSHKARFVTLTWRRIIYFWAGQPRAEKPLLQALQNSLFLGTSIFGWWGLVFAIRRRVHAIWLFTALMIFYPAVYYITFPEARFRHPLEPLIVMLGVNLCVGYARHNRERVT